MSTPDVPGADPKNGDKLAVGAWAEADNGNSLILVEGYGGGHVVYAAFDLIAKPPMEYRDQMAEQAFKREFSQVGWTWHDKSPFPWDRIMNAGIQPGPRVTPDQDVATTSQTGRFARRRGWSGKPLDPSEWENMNFSEKVDTVFDRFFGALKRHFPGGRNDNDRDDGQDKGDR